MALAVALVRPGLAEAGTRAAPPSSTRSIRSLDAFMPMVMISSAPQRLCDAEIAGVRRRLDLARQFTIGTSDSVPAEGWGEQLVLAYRTYAADVAALLDDRRRQLQDLAALRRVALSAELALNECRDSDRVAERVEQLLRALQLAGYGLRSPSCAEG